MPTAIYTTGPLENLVGAATKSNAVVSKVINNNPTTTATVTVNLYDMGLGNVQKVLISSNNLVVPPLFSSVSTSLLAAGVVEFEVELVVQTSGSISNVQLSVWGEVSGNLNPSHRVLSSELTLRTMLP